MVLLNLQAARSNASVNSQVPPYSKGEATPLEVILLSGNLLEGLLNVNSTDDQGLVTGGIDPNNLPPLLRDLGISAGALQGAAYSSTNPHRQVQIVVLQVCN